MAKIPLYEQRGAAPATSGQRTISNAQAGVGEAIAGAGAAVQDFAQKAQAKQSKTDLFEAENELRNLSRDRYIDAQENKLGKNALPNEEDGYKGVFGEYDTEANAFIEERIANLPSAHQEVARQRLSGVSEGYKDRFAVFQSEQQRSHRKQVMESSLESIKEASYTDMAAGLDPSVLFEGINQASALIKEEGAGADVKTLVDQTRKNMLENGLLAMSTKDPTRALEALETKEAKKIFDPVESEAMKETLENSETEFEVQGIITRINASELGYKGAMEAVDGMTDDDEVKQRVVSQLNWEKAQSERIKNETQYTVQEEAYADIFENGNPMSPTAIDTDPKYSALDSDQKLRVKSWLGGDSEAGQFEEAVRLDKWYAARQEIIGLRMDPSEIMGKAGTDIDFRDIKSLVKFSEDVRSEPNIKSADEYVTGIYPKIANKPKKFKKVMFQVQEDVFGFQALNSRFPSGAEMRTIVENVVEPDIDTDFQDFVFGVPVTADPGEQAYRRFNPEAERPRFQQDDPPSFIEKQLFAVRRSGYPDASFDPESGAIDLGVQPDGYRYVVGPDKQVYKRQEGAKR